MLNGIFLLYQLDKSFEFKGCWIVIFNFIQFEKFILQANSEKFGQTLCSVASDLILIRLPMSHKKDARLKSVKLKFKGHTFLKMAF